MASYHLEIKTISRKSNVTPMAKFEYINREGAYKNVNKKLPEKKFDYITRNYSNLSPESTEVIDSKLDYINREGEYKNPNESEELQYKESGNMPSWAKDNPREFWRAAEIFERANGTVFREFIFALPNELNLEQQKEMIAEFLQKNIPDNAYSYSIHKNPATLSPDIEQPHVHLIFSERLNDGIERTKDKYFSRYNPKNPETGGAKKDRKWAGTSKERKENLKNIRENFADIQNKYLAKYKHEARVDHRTLEEQKQAAIEAGNTLKAKELNRPAEKKLGPKVTRLMIKALMEHRDKFKQKSPEKPYTQEVQEDYILNNQDQKIFSKVSYNFSVRRIRKLTQQIISEYERDTNINASEKQEMAYTPPFDELVLPTKISIENLQLLISDVDKKLVEINSKIESIEKRKKDLAPQVKTEVDAERIARNRCLKKDITELNQFKELLAKHTEEYQQLYHNHIKTPKPMVFNVKQRAEYDKREETLKSLKSNINKMQIEHDNRSHEFFIKSNSTETQNNIEQIKENILYSNKAIRDEFYVLSKEQKQVITTAGYYRNFKRDVQTQLNILIKQDKLLSNQGMADMANNLKASLNNLKTLCRKNTEADTGFGKANLRLEDDDQERNRGQSL